jgi:hypothetical protein
MMQYIEAIDFETEIGYPSRSLFLAGGITNCPDWQSEVVSKLSGLPLTILNPRRKSFNMEDPNESEKQIRWEYYHLRRASHTLFWFPEETLCPITLFELGSALERVSNFGNNILIGIHPNYKRRFDIEVQTKLRMGWMTQLFYSLDKMIEQVKERIF